MLILITMWEENPKTKKASLVVSHGVDERTGKNVCLPGEHPSVLGGTYSEELREWVILDYPGETAVNLQAEPPATPAAKGREAPAADWFSEEYSSPSM